MALSKATLKTLLKEDIINFALDYQYKFNTTLLGTRNERSELKSFFELLGSEMAVTEYIKGILQKMITNMER